MNYGRQCIEFELIKPWIGNCSFDTAYEVLQHIYGDLEVTCQLAHALHTSICCGFVANLLSTCLLPTRSARSAGEEG